MRAVSFALLIGSLLSLSNVKAQEPSSPAPAASTSPDNTSNSTWKGLTWLALGDGYADINFNHPGNGFNGGYDFNDKANTAHLNLAKVALEKPTGVLGFRLDVGTGRTLDQLSLTDTAAPAVRYFEQFFVEFRPPNTHGLELDFGKFATSAGSELIESYSNWIYSRSLLFSLACPYYHFGLRASMPVTKSLTAGVQVVDGWNNVGTTNNFSTVGLTDSYAWKKITWANTYYFGKQLDGGVLAARKIVDSNILFNATANDSFYLNFDYGSNRRPGEEAAAWYGIAGAGRHQVTKHLAFAARGEWFRDADGYATGTSQNIKEVTATGEWKFNDHFISRLEYRRDMSDAPFYDRGTGVMVASNQSTVTLALMAQFGSRK